MERRKIDGEIALDNIIIASTLSHRNPNTQSLNIIKAFNSRVVEGYNTFEKSLFFGDWVNPNSFILGACNQIPEIHHTMEHKS